MKQTLVTPRLVVLTLSAQKRILLEPVNVHKDILAIHILVVDLNASQITIALQIKLAQTTNV